MQIPDKLKIRLANLGLSESIYSQRTRKCILSREKLQLERVPWYEQAYYIPDNFENKKEYFIFDPASLVPCLALDPKPTDRILDMCAAPGTKTFILSFLTGNKAHITANDISRQRISRLEHNAEKFGLNCEITNLSGRKIEGSFSKILLDAPCSGEGIVNKKEKVFSAWSERRVKFLAKKQKKLIANAFRILADGGVLVYSTCTFAPEENEAVIDFLLKKHDAAIEAIDAKINHSRGIIAWNGREFDKRVAECMRIYPQHSGTGGFFAARIIKKHNDF